MRKLYLTKLAVFFACCSAFASAESADGILPQSLILSLQVEELFEYQCPSNTQCQLRCGPAEQAIKYQNVKRAELARGAAHWVFGVVYLDSLGKGHQATGFLPEPASCVLDDLAFVAQIPVIDGALNRAPEEVIFDLSPSN
jgi:hypothetical protein